MQEPEESEEFVKPVEPAEHMRPQMPYLPLVPSGEFGAYGAYGALGPQILQTPPRPRRIRATCVHVVREREQCIDCVEYDARRCKRALDGSDGRCEMYAENEEGALVVVRVASALPFVNQNFCYWMLAENEEGLNNIIRMNGCLDVKINVVDTTHRAILHGAVSQSGIIQRQRVKSCMTQIRSRILDDDAFENLIAESFRHIVGADQLMASIRIKLSAAIGWFTRDTRTVGAALYCMGFANREFLSRELWAEEGTQQSWFLSLGDADLQWLDMHGSLIDQQFETFGDFRASFLGLGPNFIKCLEGFIRMDPERFFCTNTRPMALRGLGAMNKDNFMAYCANMMPPLILDAENLISIDPESVEDEVFVMTTAYDTVYATCAMSEYLTVQRCAVTAMTSLVIAQQKHKLRFVREHELVQEIASDGRRLIDWNAHGFGDGGSIREVHILCATRQICFVFHKHDMGDGPHGAEAATAFKCGHSHQCEAQVYFRDAHLLTCNMFSHLMWRLSKRVKFSGFTLSHRCSDDWSYHSLMWAFMRRLDVPGIPGTSEALEMAETPSISGLGRHELVNLDGVCVVPMADDAHEKHLLLAVGCYVFVINPPIFGKVQQMVPDMCTLTVSGGGTRQVPRYLYKNTPNVLRCKSTPRGAYLVPASALLTLRSGRNVRNVQEITLLLPISLSLVWKADMLALAKGVARSVKVVRVETYTFNEGIDARIDELVKIVQDNLVIP